jgi:hypothetical protein
MTETERKLYRIQQKLEQIHTQLGVVIIVLFGIMAGVWILVGQAIA